MGETTSASYELLRSVLEALESTGLGCTAFAEREGRAVRLYANAALARLYGVDVEETQGLDMLAMFPPEERARVRATIEARGAPASTPFEARILRRDGVEVPVEIGLGHATMGDVRVTFCFVRDTTHTRKMETALQESEALFRRLFDAAPDSIALYAEGRCLYANPVALAFMGHTREELSDVDPWEHVPAERRAIVNDHLARSERGETSTPLMHRTRDKDGNERILEASVSFMTFEGKPSTVAWTRDVTERMRLQAELMKRDRLASVGLLAAGVAHEINNPLTSLKLQTRCLSARAAELCLPEDVRASLAQIDDAASRMSAIIGDLLFMAKPVEQPQAHVDVSAILASTLSLLRAGRSTVPELRLELDALPPIRAYASKLAQVFFNVLRNALQAVESKGPCGEIRIRGRVVEDRVEIIISDNGPGIPRDVLPRVAQPFFTTRPDGTGLGLWMSQSIMSLHGGSVDVSSPGEGTVVTLRLPI